MNYIFRSVVHLFSTCHLINRKCVLLTVEKTQRKTLPLGITSHCLFCWLESIVSSIEIKSDFKLPYLFLLLISTSNIVLNSKLILLFFFFNLRICLTLWLLTVKLLHISAYSDDWCYSTYIYVNIKDKKTTTRHFIQKVKKNTHTLKINK